ncbi:calcium-binding protein [Methylobacterium sp. SD274]|uniref:calcium-binding protein n=1 Tax=Methylobacterium sp. SD274 TaxID=2782009 RepID=UPI001FEFDE3D|nr:calcium-binding protein [Methylobacterium sp. SD274]
MASVSFTFGGNYDFNNLVNLSRNGLDSYSGPSDPHAIGFAWNGYFIINDNGIQDGLGTGFEDAERFDSDPIEPMPIFVNGNDYSINADLSDNTAMVNLQGGTFGDVLRGGSGGDTIAGGDGNDIMEGGAEADTFDGGSGSDTVSYEHASGGVYARLDERTGYQGDAQGDVFTNIENLVGSTSDDSLVGDASNNTIRSNGGLDDIGGMGGDDRIVISETPFYVGGGAGKDFLFVSGGGTVSLARGMFEEFEATYVRNDTKLDMSAITTGATVTSQSTAGHHVEITGTSGNDSIRAGRGGDTIEGSTGNDKLIAGLGDDTFRFETGFGRDVVYKFSAGSDTFDVSALVDSFDEIKISQVHGGVNTLITFKGEGSGNKIILRDVDAASLHADDFGFLSI